MAGAPSGPAWPCWPRAAAMGVGVSEAVLWFIRRWLVARGTMGVEADIRKDLYARLQILPMSFHGRWQSGQLLSRIMNDLSTIRRFMSFGLVFLLLNVSRSPRDGHPAGDVLAAWCGRAAVDRADHPTVLHFQQEYTRLSRLAQDQSGPRRDACRGVRARPAGGEIVRPRGLRLRPVRRTAHQPLRHRSAGYRCRRSSGPAGDHPEPHADHRARPRRVRGRPRLRHHGHTRRVHHHDAVAGLAHRIARLPAVDDAGVLHRGQPDRRDLRRPRKSPTVQSRRRGGRLELVDVELPFPAATRRLGAAPRHVTVDPARRWPSSARRVGQVGAASLLSRLYDVTEGEIRIDGGHPRACPAGCARRWPPLRGPDTVLHVGGREPCAGSAARDQRR